MHFAFIPYGKRSEVELLFRDMEAQKHLLKMKKGDKEIGRWIQGGLRCLPLGVYEYVFPKEDMEVLLKTLMPLEKNRYNIPNFVINLIRKLYRYKKIPKYETDKQFIWVMNHVEIIPLGIREDASIIEPEHSEHAGFEHEAL